MEYLYQGLTRSIGFHLVSGAVLLALSAVGAPSPASFVSPAMTRINYS
jgi:hypothetical protein